ncbi:unnamed protein product [Lota lota]
MPLRSFSITGGDSRARWCHRSTEAGRARWCHRLHRGWEGSFPNPPECPLALDDLRCIRHSSRRAEPAAAPPVARWR